MVIYDDYGIPSEDDKRYASNFLKEKRSEYVGLAQRVKEDKILESDLFFLKRYLARDFILKTQKYKFQILE